jgi:hypothetical protein
MWVNFIYTPPRRAIDRPDFFLIRESWSRKQQTVGYPEPGKEGWQAKQESAEDDAQNGEE